MWKIKDITIDSEVVLAPMAGVSFLAYRDFMKPFGVGLSVSEMVSDCGLIYNNQTTPVLTICTKALQKRNGSRRSRPYYRIIPRYSSQCN